MRILAAPAALLFALVLPGLASAASRPTVQLKLTGSVVSKSADGRTVLTPVEKEAPKSGDTVEYAIAATNVGTAPALKLMPQGKIPFGTSYVAGSAKAQHAKVEFSLDQGKTWSASPTVTVKGPSGTPVVKKADPSLYTMIRFVTDGALAPHGTALYSYEVHVK